MMRQLVGEHEMTTQESLLVAPISIPPATEEQLGEVVQRIVKAFNPLRIVLFGSYAWGNPTPDSDVDLLIVMDDSDRPARRSARVSRVLLDIPFPIDILVRTPEELRYRLRIGDCFIREIMVRGRVLYERD